METRHKDDVPGALEADDALLLALVLDGSARSFLRYFSRRGGEGVVQLGELGGVAPRRRDVEVVELLDERSARRGPLAQLRARFSERLAAGARIHLEAVSAPLGERAAAGSRRAARSGPRGWSTTTCLRGRCSCPSDPSTTRRPTP